MDFSFSDEQVALRDLARKILEDLATNERLKEIESKDPVFDEKLWSELAKANLVGVAIPEEFGGSGFGSFELAILLQEVGRAVAPVPALATLALGALPITAWGSAEQKQSWLPRIAQGDAILSAALVEADSADALAPKTTATADGDGWILNGAKCFIGGASRSDWILVQATLDASKGRAAQRAFFVEQGAEGLGPFKIEKKMGLKAYESSSFTLDHVRVPAENLLGGESRYERKAGFKAAMATFNAGRPVIAANAVGIGRAALDEVILFARENDLLGDSRVRDRIEAITRKVRMARLVCLRAGQLADEQRPNIVEASMSKALAAQVAQEATSQGLELLGTVGARGDHLIEKLYRDAKAMDIVEGTGQIQRMIISRSLVGLPR